MQKWSGAKDVISWRLRAVVWQLGEGYKREQQGCKSEHGCVIERGCDDGM